MSASPDLHGEDIHLDPEGATELYYAWADRFHGPCVLLWWDMPLDKIAATQRSRDGYWIAFAGYGCTLDTLAHELAHCVTWDDEDHGEEWETAYLLISEQLKELVP